MKIAKETPQYLAFAFLVGWVVFIFVQAKC